MVIATAKPRAWRSLAEHNSFVDRWVLILAHALDCRHRTKAGSQITRALRSAIAAHRSLRFSETDAENGLM
jgi:hypothetical protein